MVHLIMKMNINLIPLTRPCHVLIPPHMKLVILLTFSHDNVWPQFQIGFVFEIVKFHMMLYFIKCSISFKDPPTYAYIGQGPCCKYFSQQQWWTHT